MAEQDQDILLGRLAVHYKILSKEQAQQAIRLWRSTPTGLDLGEFLVSESYIAPDALPKLLKARKEYLRRSEAKAQTEPPAAPQPTPPVGAATVRLTPEMVAAAAAATPGVGAPPVPAPTVAMQLETQPPSNPPEAPELPTPEPAVPAPIFETAPEPAMSELPEPESLAPELPVPEPAAEPLVPEPAAPELFAPELPVPEPAAPELFAPELPVPEPAAPELFAPELPVPEPAAPELFAPEPSTPGLEELPVSELPAPEPAANELFAPEPSAPGLEELPVSELPAPEPATDIFAPEPTAPAVPVSEVPAPIEISPEIEVSPEMVTLAEPAEVVPEEPGENSVEAIETIPEGQGVLGYTPGVTLEDLLRRACELGASDMHIHSGAPLKIRIHGELRDASQQVDRDSARELVYGVLTEEQRAVLEEHQQLDFSFEIAGTGRFRSNSYFQHRGLDGVFRIIPPEPPTLEDLGLPEALGRFSEYHQGIVLFTGPAGCGKSSTMAALVRRINESRPDHILTIEDPIEYVHLPARCVVNQREVGPHTESFGRALRAALREDPDIIVIGELRDLETISLALTAAETGHLVLGTLHTASSIPTLNRLVGVFPPDQQAQIRTMVSESLCGIVSQRLVRRADGEGRVPALEILVNNRAIGNLVRENRTFQIKSILQTGAREGMCELDSSLAELVKKGIITKEVAKSEAIEPKRFA